jgi:hypothetical protein
MMTIIELLYWIDRMKIEDNILSLMSNKNSAIEYLMRYFDHRESDMIFEHYSL